MIKPFIAQDLREVSPLVLAYIGDSIYELYARCKSATLGAGSNNKMHNNTVRYVSAEAQAISIRALAGELTETETDYFRRGKNSNPHAVSKNATHADYMYATGFEALLGYLFLNNEEPRMEYLIYKSFDICDGVISTGHALGDTDHDNAEDEK